MQRIQGIAVSPGVAIGEALVMDTEGFRIPRRYVAADALSDELVRLDQAIEAASAEVRQNRDAVAHQLGEQYAAIFDAHLQILHDPKLRSELEELIQRGNFSPEHAVATVLRRYVKVFQGLKGGNFADRSSDIIDVEKRLLRNLLGQAREELSKLTSPVVVLAHDLTPSETANLDRKFVRGFATEMGGSSSHTAIVAEAMEIPAVVGLGTFLTDVSGGDTVIIDGHQGFVILQPDEETLAQYRREAEHELTFAATLETLRDLPAETADGVRIELLGNIEFPYEVEHCLERGVGGIGLYRTEFLYLSAATEPTEDTHFEAYSRVVKAMGNKPVVIRTLDLGADKLAQMPSPEAERNPVLGLRSIRMSLRNLPPFRTQLRAILRASALGDVRLMFPLITTLTELRQARMIVADVMEDLDEHGIAFNRDIPVGIMVEVPAAVMMIDRFVQEVAFVSIGTNDLVQYALAVDRSNKDVAGLYNSCDPAILRLIDQTVQAARRADIPANLCGRMSSSTRYTQLLLGMGLRQFSVAPSAAPEIKRLIRATTISQCEEIARRAMSMESAREIKAYLREERKKIAPELDQR
jgi:phosphotransferase system enzyme I (PtsI)